MVRTIKWTAFWALLLACTATQLQASLITNGGFDTGDFTGWTIFTTPNGTLNSPAVASFDTTGIGTSLAGQFNVAEIVFDGTQQGGGIFQSVMVSTPGNYQLSVDIASDRPSGALNGSGGVFTLLLDNNVIDSHDFGAIPGNTTLRSSLGTVVALGTGSHELRILITRPFATSGLPLNQYVDNASFEAVASVPEPPQPDAGRLGCIRLGVHCDSPPSPHESCGLIFDQVTIRT